MSLLRRPVQPRLIAASGALWTGSLFCDLLYVGGAEAAIWSPLALYTLVAGFAAALAAAVPQLRKLSLAHVPIHLIVLCLYAVNLLMRLGDSPNSALAIALSALGLAILAISSWLGAGRLRAEGVRSLLLVAGVAAFVGLAGWIGPAGAQLFSSTGPVIAIFEGELLLGEATGHLGGWGTIALHSRGNAERTCEGEFTHGEAQGDSGELRCSDGASAAFRFQRLTLRQGYGVGSALSFTYGLSAEDSAAYLDLPPGKALRREGEALELVAR